jgi:hypothetical protein
MTFERSLASLVEPSEKRGGGCALALGGFTSQPPTLKRGDSLEGITRQPPTPLNRST